MSDPAPIRLEELQEEHRELLLKVNTRSQDLHDPWVSAPTSDGGFDAYLRRAQSPDTVALLAFSDDDLVGVINLNHIVRRNFQNAHLGYYANADLAGQGLMKAAMEAVVTHAFEELDLHRLEANIQPDNTRSIRLVESVGFRHEGLARNLIHIKGGWRDHERYAITVEDWSRDG
ncbi:MAG: GNAT family protein [Nitriliruptorales bacterium]|nr:GNAT family protein [Nitriliruptorales bacterium]